MTRRLLRITCDVNLFGHDGKGDAKGAQERSAAWILLGKKIEGNYEAGIKGKRIDPT